jgi:drug/metabolite transporter (DMT)-like permease
MFWFRRSRRELGYEEFTSGALIGRERRVWCWELLWRLELNFIGPARAAWLTLRMLRAQSNFGVGFALLFAIFLWGGNNTGTKVLVGAWPPVWTGGTRFLAAGLVLLAILRWTRWLGPHHSPPPETRRDLWLRGGLSLAVYIVAFNWAVRYTSPSHVALYLGASPVWALLWEATEDRTKLTVRRLSAALLALAGVAVLLWPALRATSLQLTGELLGLAASVLWVGYGRQCRRLTNTLSGAEVSAQTMWRAGVWLMPVSLLEIAQHGLSLNWQLASIQLYCIVAGGVIAFAIWNNALRVWSTSQVLLFNNLIPPSTMVWAHYWLGEPVTVTFWLAMILIAAGVVLGLLSPAGKNAPDSVSQPE